MPSLEQILGFWGAVIRVTSHLLLKMTELLCSQMIDHFTESGKNMITTA